MTEQELLQALPAGNREAVKRYLDGRGVSVHPVVQVLLFVGAFISSVALMLSTFMMFYRVFPTAFAVWGGALYAAAGYGLLRAGEGRKSAGAVFFSQFGFIFAVSGKCLLIYGVVSLFFPGGVFYGDTSFQLFISACVTAAVAAAGWPFFKQPADRFIFSAAALGLFAWYAASLWGRWCEPVSWLGAALCFMGILLFAFRAVGLRPLAYALLAVGGVSVACGPDKFAWGLVPAAGLAAWAVSRAKGLSVKGRAWGCMLVALAACMLGLSAFTALCVMTAGRGLRERTVQWLGSVWFACALFMLYYDLGGSLLYKSGMLAVSGLAALAAYFALKRGVNAYAR